MLKYCSIGSGSSGNCHYIEYKDTGILVDAGLSGKRITTGLDDIGINMENIKGIFITHEHSDHIKGAGIMSRKYNIPIFANVKTWCAMKDKLGNIESNNMKVFENDKTYSLGDVVIRPFSIPHDASDAVGYNFYTGNDKMSIATDIGYIDDNIRRHLYKSKLVILESNYDPNMLMMGSYPYSLKKRVMSEEGHLSNEDAAKFCVELINNGTERILLAHLSKENNFPELAYETSKSILTQNDIIVGQDVKLDVLLREEVSDIYKVK
ncbi:MBL fold metallo-hydrolase [Romboutsia sp. 1001216sp1]|uniref:MBL fold metallo-hydrolase n=1 Tax=unclassified Romboutsia TaxID=2626894 RepID=UPI0018AAA352|nr:MULTISPECIES: MBL fold metallo-hydrolase [unclassified Romboutsia]MDB8794001.1 MBL fold metallo-hydrolase [Romboutsia sp. 1001216sp1]MDB8796928.1 MBL fold metallo-hydrolase [Romboutsia sp. 1001216sp1]MDB8800142.1 MBL fold metallo-hydrolase [Romboutsia sp. 1001216sp1]